MRAIMYSKQKEKKKKRKKNNNYGIKEASVVDKNICTHAYGHFSRHLKNKNCFDFLGSAVQRQTDWKYFQAYQHQTIDKQ